jgi:hypothetical protein
VHWFTTHSQSLLRPIISGPVRLNVKHPSGTRDQFLFCLEIVFRHLRVCYFVALSLTRGRACNLLLLLVLTSAVQFGSDSRETEDNILMSQFLRLPQPGGPGPSIYIPQEQDGPYIPPGVSLSVSSYEDMLVLLYTAASRYYNYSTDGSTGPVLDSHRKQTARGNK